MVVFRLFLELWWRVEFFRVGVRPVLAADENFLPFFVFIAKARPKPPFGNPRAFQPPKQNIIIFLVFLFYIDSHSMYIFDALSLIIESSTAMSAQLPRPSAFAGAAMAITILCQIVV
jgi:hypothetical protein